MIANKTYGWMHRAWLNCGRSAHELRLNTVGNAAGLTKGELTDLAEQLGIDVEVVTGPVIVLVKRKCGLHYVVITEDGKVLDPEP